MTISEFRSLPQEDQANAAWNGVFLAGRTTRKYFMLLYDIDGFYVEVVYDKESNCIKKFRAFKSTLFLEPYLSQINIQELV